MSRKSTAQSQKQQSNTSSNFTDNANYENIGGKSMWDANVRQLRHQNSFSGVSYLDVIKERERSDSGFSGDVYEEFSNEAPFLNNIPERDDFSRLYDNLDEYDVNQQKNAEAASIKTHVRPIVSSAKNIGSRRESYDSGLSVSPSNQTPPQFHIEFEDSDSKNNCQITHKDEKSDSTRAETRDDTTPPPARRRKKKKRLCGSLSVTQFCDLYRLTGEVLGQGSYGKVEECANILTNAKYAVKIISKSNVHFSRPKMLKEIELYFLCQGVPEIIQLIEYFEEPQFFYLVFEKAKGGPLLSQIQRRVHFTEREAAAIIRDLAAALSHLHSRGIAHRDVKPENVLCYNDGENGQDDFLPVKLCDFDLCSAVYQSISTPKLQSPVGSVEYMAPEVVEAFSVDLDFFGHEMQTDNYDEEDDVELTYDKRCDLWSLGIIAYILLCGYLPFSGRCGEDCGWEDRGEECSECQHRLFQSIKSGTLTFPEKHWSGVSSEAKDLITKLLVRDASQRLDATSILNHPWIIQHSATEQSIGAEESCVAPTDLETPRVLRRRNSTQEIMFYSEFASNALAIKRNCVDHHGTVTLLKKPMKKSATVSELFDGNDVSMLHTYNDSAKKEDISVPINVCQNNNSSQLLNYMRSKHSKDDEKQECHTSNDISYPRNIKDCNNFSRERENQHPKVTNRQQSCQNYLTHPSPFSKHMRRQTSLVVFASNYEKDINEEGCRWEF
jgi:MAP kinase interacting serine/threonine kinase